MEHDHEIRIAGAGVSSQAPPDLEDWFPGRWDPRRSMPPEVAILVHAVARALGAAGWWERGSGKAVPGGLVVGADLHALGPSLRFAHALEEGGLAMARPSDFLLSLPSSAAAMVGVALGLDEHQATIAMHGLSGFQAVAYGGDLLRGRGLERVVAAALTVTPEVARGGEEPFALAIAWCLDAPETAGMSASSCIEDWASDARTGSPSTAAGDEIDTAELLAGTKDDHRCLAAPSLLAASRFLEQAEPGTRATLVHRDTFARVRARLSLRAGARMDRSW